MEFISSLLSVGRHVKQVSPSLQVLQLSAHVEAQFVPYVPSLQKQLFPLTNTNPLSVSQLVQLVLDGPVHAKHPLEHSPQAFTPVE